MDPAPPKRRKLIQECPTSEEETLGGCVVDDKEDRISNLPDGVLCHILSKLPTRYAVGTTILSSKWKILFPKSLISDSSSMIQTGCQGNPKFVNFMHHLLNVTLSDVRLVDKLNLDCKQHYEDEDIDTWISAALRLNVSRLSLLLHEKDTGVSLDTIFNSPTLVELLLMQQHILNIPSSVYLPNLKTLFLDYVKFRDGLSLQTVLSACPVLEEMALGSCEFEEINVFSLRSPSLKHFMLGNCYQENFYGIVIDMPALEFLYYDDHVPDSYYMINLKSLRKAHLDVGPSSEQEEYAEEEDIARYKQNVADLVTACSNVDFLYLSNVTTYIIYTSLCPMPSFYNLTKLKLSNAAPYGWKILPHLLRSAPNLEVLVFMGGFPQYKGCYKKFLKHMPHDTPSCLTLHLLVIEFEGFNGEEDEIKLVEYFLKHALVLKKMWFSFSPSLPSEKQFYTWFKLMNLRARLKTCRFDFAIEIQDIVLSYWDAFKHEKRFLASLPR